MRRPLWPVAQPAQAGAARACWRQRGSGQQAVDSSMTLIIASPHNSRCRCDLRVAGSPRYIVYYNCILHSVYLVYIIRLYCSRKYTTTVCY